MASPVIVTDDIGPEVRCLDRYRLLCIVHPIYFFYQFYAIYHVLCALIQPYKCRRIHVFLAFLLCFGIAALPVLALWHCGIVALSPQFRNCPGIGIAPAFGILALSALWGRAE